MRNKGSSTSTATATEDESPPTPGRSDTQIGPPTQPVCNNQDVNVLIVEVPTVVRSVAELQDMDSDMAAFVAEYDARDVRYEELAAADSDKVHQVNATGASKQDEQERAHRVRKDERATMLDKSESFSDLRPKRARDTRALSPIHCQSR